MSISLNGRSRISWVRPDGCPSGFEPFEVVVGNSDAGGMALEIAITKWSRSEPPTREALTRLHTLRTNKRATPVVLVVEFDSGGTLVFGPNTASAPVGPLPVEQTQRVVQAALDEPTVIAARNRLAGLVQSIDSTSMPGVKNSGLFANHELRVGVPQRADWGAACSASTSLLSLKGKELIEKLGFQAGQFGAHALLLTGEGPKAEAIAVLLDDREAFDADSPRFTVSPVAYGLNMAEKQGVPWLIMVRGSQIRLYSSRKDFGVGRKGLAETFFEVDLPQLTASNSGYLKLIFSAKALAEGGTTYEILKSSSQYAVALGERLRDKVYEEIIPELSVSVAGALKTNGYKMDAAGLDLAYQLTLRVFFRMLFQVYAEDRKLLPYGENTKYDRNAIKTVAKDLAENPEQIFDENSTSLWDDLAQVWRVIDSGDKAWGVPAYNGGLFASDSELSEHGAILKDVHITNDVMGPVLRALLLDDSEDGTIGPVDFRSLSVREFGTIYEGLLESSLGLAEVDLTLDEDGTWIPAKKKDEIYAEAGQVYFHNTSGQRKGTGSYFTPSFVVEHLLERSLDPALDSHLAQVGELIKKGDHAGAAEMFFDFRVADLAMGSGHFLTSAIDHIEQKMAAFLAEDGQSIPGVAIELLKLEDAAKEALGENFIELERSSLLRRQIARRCIYGLDINPIAVELARVSIWIHTFVRGLPMSSLDQNLICANSLTGIASVEEAMDVLVKNRIPGQPSILDAPISEALEAARKSLWDVSQISEANRDESRAAAKGVRHARRLAEKAKLIFDGAVLMRLGRGDLVAASDPDGIVKMVGRTEVQTEIELLRPAHFPVLFPEVFLRSTPGFDVLIGNPPWEEVVTEELKFWTAHVPGLKSMKQGERMKVVDSMRKRRPDLVSEYSQRLLSDERIRASLLVGPYPEMGTGDPDLYKAFAWRNLQLLSSSGRAGIVLPRTAFTAKGSSLWRRQLLEGKHLCELVTLINNSKWVFESVHPQYQVALAVFSGGQTERFSMRGPLFSIAEFHNKSRVIQVGHETVFQWSETASIPALSSQESVEIFTRMSEAPKLGPRDDFEYRPVAEVSASLDKSKFFFEYDERTDDAPVVYGGSSFDIWKPDTGDYFGWARPLTLAEILEKRKRQVALKSSAFFGLGLEWAVDESTLPYKQPRIAFRDITRATDRRTVRCALVPPGVILNNKAPYLFRVRGTERSDAYLLGVLSSMVFDWQARQVVELGLNPSLLQSLHVPAFNDEGVTARIADVAATLAYVNSEYEDWARAAGIICEPISDEAQRQSLIHELDALVGMAFRLTRQQIVHIFTSFHRDADYSSYLESVLKHIDQTDGLSQ